MIYIVEGVNGVGKSNYCSELSKYLNIPVLRQSRPETRQAAMRDPIALYEIINAFKIDSFIIDRFYPSEFVYHPHYFEDFAKIEDIYKDISVLIYLMATKEIILERWSKRKEKINYNLDILMDKFEEFLSRTALTTIILHSKEGKNYAKVTL